MNSSGGSEPVVSPRVRKTIVSSEIDTKRDDEPPTRWGGATEVGDDRCRAADRTFRKDDPVGLLGLAPQRAGIGRAQIDRAGLPPLDESLEELAAEDS